MSADFTKVLVKDDRLDVTDNIKYAVIKGGQNMTCAPFSAISESGSQITFNIQVPSEQTIIDRRVLLEAVLTLTVTSQIKDKTTGQPSTFQTGQSGGYGYSMSLAPFPIHELFTVMSATINNNTVSINIRDVLPAITRLLEKRELSCYNGTTPTYLDSYASFSDALQTINNPNASYANALDSDIYPRGSFQVIGYKSLITQTTVANDTLKETFAFKITEPLLLSPFIYSNPQSNSQGFYGIQNLNFIFNVGNTNRVWRGLTESTDVNNTPSNTSTSPAPYGTPYVTKVEAGDTMGENVVSVPPGNTYAFSTDPLSSCRLLFEFLTPHPSDLMPAKNIVPYYELPRYITGLNGSDLFNGVNAKRYTRGSTDTFLVSSVSNRVNSQSLQLNQIPDKLIVFLRKTLGSQTWGDADVANPINNISINFNNNSGLLASATKQDLYKMAKDNGSNQNWLEWYGLGNVTKQISYNIPQTQNYVNWSSSRGVSTVGSYLVLEFGKDIQLVEDFYAPGSLGNFNLQLQLTFENNLEYQNDKYDLVIVTMNSGVFVNERGTSSTYTGILTKADVLEASEQVPFTRADVKRMVGGGFLDLVKSSVSKLAPVAKALAPLASDYLKGHSNKYANMAGELLGKVGHGESGGGMSAGKTRLGKHMM